MKIKQTNDGIIVEIFVKPMSKNSRIKSNDDEVLFYSKKLAHKGKVNKDLIKVLSQLFGKEVKIVSGFASNNKRVFIKDLDQEIFEQKIKLGI